MSIFFRTRRVIVMTAVMLLAATVLHADAAVIRNHAVWVDTDGNRIDCHEGSILRVDSVFYWHCRSYRGNPDGVYGREGARFRNGINCYSSHDLEQWTFRGTCLPYPDDGWLTRGTWHRPRVIFNAQTGRYVLWFFVFPPGDHQLFALTVAVADSPVGPFTVVTGPENPMGGDLATFLDVDGQGYLAYDQDRHIRVTRLSEDFRSLTGHTTIALPNWLQKFEGAAMARYKGKYLVAGSGVNGLNPTDTSYAVADSPLGPYTFKGFMSKDLTWSSQISAFVYIAESDTLFAMCEQWLRGPNGERVPAEQSTQLWLPVTFDPNTGEARMQHVQEWNPWANGVRPPANLRIIR